MKDNILKQDPRTVLPKSKLRTFYDDYGRIILFNLFTLAIGIIFSLTVIGIVPSIGTIAASIIFASLQGKVMTEILRKQFQDRPFSSTPDQNAINELIEAIETDKSSDLEKVKETISKLKFRIYPEDLTHNQVVKASISNRNPDLLCFILKSFQSTSQNPYPVIGRFFQSDMIKGSREIFSEIHLISKQQNNPQVMKSLENTISELAVNYYTKLNDTNSSFLKRTISKFVTYSLKSSNIDYSEFNVFNDFLDNKISYYPNLCQALHNTLSDLRNDPNFSEATKEEINSTLKQVEEKLAAQYSFDNAQQPRVTIPSKTPQSNVQPSQGKINAL